MIHFEGWKVLFIGIIILLSCNQANNVSSTISTSIDSIDGNASLAAASISGTGTLQDPYILSNANAYSNSDCYVHSNQILSINNTDKYFVLEGSASNNCYYTLTLNNVSHAEIKNLFIYFDFQIVDTNNITLMNLYVTNFFHITNVDTINITNVINHANIFLEKTSNFVIRNVTKLHLMNTNNGVIEQSYIDLINNSSNVIVKNSSTSFFKMFNSIDIDFQDFFIKSEYTIQNGTNIIFTPPSSVNSGMITIKYSNNISLSNFQNHNMINMNYDKNVILQNISTTDVNNIGNSQNITVEDSIINNSGPNQYSYGIYVFRSNYIKIINNKMNGFPWANQKAGEFIKIDHSNNIQIINNTLNNAINAITLNFGEKCVIDRNNLTSNIYGITLSESSLNTISNNYIKNSSFIGMDLKDSTNNTIINNIITQSKTGIHLDNSSNNFFKNNSYIDVLIVYSSTLNNKTNIFLDKTSSSVPGFDFGVFLIASCIIIKRRRFKK